MTGRDPEGKDSELAQRMRRLRIYYEDDDTGAISRFAVRVSLPVKRWSNYENGFPVGLPAAKDLVKRCPGLTLDWIYFGSLAGLPVNMADGLKDPAAEDAEEAADEAKSA